MDARGFPATFAAMLSPFLVWAGHFGAVYAFNGVVCARGLDGETLLGLPLATVAVTAATLLALLAVALLLARAVRGAGPAGGAADPGLRRFARWFTVAGAGTALVAILWTCLPALQLPACG